MRIERQEFSIYTEPSPQSPSQPFSNVRTSATASREEGALLGGSDMSGLRHVRPPLSKRDWRRESITCTAPIQEIGGSAANPCVWTDLGPSPAYL